MQNNLKRVFIASMLSYYHKAARFTVKTRELCTISLGQIKRS